MVLTGAGGAFCSGADLGDPNGPGHRPTRSRASPACGGWATWPWPCTASPSRPSPRSTASPSAPGLSLALGCDLIVCSDRAKLSMIFSRRGLSLDNGASWLLPRLVGMARAKEIALFGGMWSGEEAPAMGLVNRVAPAGRARAFVDDWAATLAAGPPLALSMTKTLLHASAQAIHGAGGRGRGPVPGRSTSPPEDTAEAMAASARSGDPVFTGRSAAHGNRVGLCSTASREWSATRRWSPGDPG